MDSMVALRVRPPASTTAAGVLESFLGMLRESRKDRHIDRPTRRLGYRGVRSDGGHLLTLATQNLKVFIGTARGGWEERADFQRRSL